MLRGSYEYYILDINTEDYNELEKQLCDLGQKGWHLSQVIDEGNAFIFERQCDGIKPYSGRKKLNPESGMDSRDGTALEKLRH